MKPYADSPGRRTAQIVGDLLVVAWIVLWIRVGNAVHDGTMALAGPGRQTDESASAMAGQLRDAGGRLGETPLVEDAVAVIALTVALSVTLHGITAGPLGARYRRSHALAGHG